MTIYGLLSDIPGFIFMMQSGYLDVLYLERISQNKSYKTSVHAVFLSTLLTPSSAMLDL